MVVLDGKMVRTPFLMKNSKMAGYGKKMATKKVAKKMATKMAMKMAKKK